MDVGLGSLVFGLEHPLDADILMAAVHGFTRVDIHAHKLERYLAHPDFDIRDLTRLFLRTQPGALDGVPPIAFDASGRGAALEVVGQWGQAARRVGASRLILRPAVGMATDNDVTTTLALLGAGAQRWSIQLALAIAPDGPPALASAAAATATLRSLAHPAVGLLIETDRWHATGGSADDLAALPAELVAHVHLADVLPSDAERRLPGTGVLPLADDVRAIRATGATPWWTLATESPGVAEEPAALAQAGRTALVQLLADAGLKTQEEGL